VIKVIREKNMVVIQGVNLKFKKVQDEEMVMRTKTLQKEHPLHISNVALIDPELKVPTRIKIGYLEDGTKVRVSKKTGAVIPKPDRSNLTYFNRTKELKAGPLDTTPEAVHKKTYTGEDFTRVYMEFDAYLQEKAALEHKLVFDDEHIKK